MDRFNSSMTRLTSFLRFAFVCATSYSVGVKAA